MIIGKHDISFNNAVKVVKCDICSNTYYIAGDFTSVTVDGTTYSVNYIFSIIPGIIPYINSLNGGLSSNINIMEIAGSDVFVSDTSISNINGTLSRRIARWNNNTNAWYINTLGYVGPTVKNPSILTMKAKGNYLYVGGEFNVTGNTSISRNIVRYNMTTYMWESMGNGLSHYNHYDYNDYSYVNDIIIDASNNVYATGKITSIHYFYSNIIGISYIAKWNNATSIWEPFTGLNKQGITVFIDEATSELYVGLSTNSFQIMRYNTSTSSWNTFGSSTNGWFVNKIIKFKNNIYITGDFTKVGNVNASYIAMWNGTTWNKLKDSPINTIPYSMYADNDYLYISTTPGFYRWDGNAWFLNTIPYSYEQTNNPNPVITEEGKLCILATDKSFSISHLSYMNFNIPKLLNGKKSVQVSHNINSISTIDQDGYLYTFGNSEYSGNFGQSSGNLINGRKAVQVSSCKTFTAVVDASGYLYVYGITYGTNPYTSPSLMSGRKVKQVSCGDYNFAVIDVSGRLCIYGSNITGQLATFATPSLVDGKSASQVSCSDNIVAVITDDGYLYIYKNSSYVLPSDFPTTATGALINGKKVKQVSIKYSYMTVVTVDGYLNTYGYSQVDKVSTYAYKTSHSPIGSLLNNKRVLQATTDGFYWYAINEDGNLYTVGSSGIITEYDNDRGYRINDKAIIYTSGSTFPFIVTRPPTLETNASTISWVGGLPNISYYTVDVASDSSLNQLIPEYTNIQLSKTTNSLRITDLSNNYTYYYRVRSYGSGFLEPDTYIYSVLIRGIIIEKIQLSSSIAPVSAWDTQGDNISLHYSGNLGIGTTNPAYKLDVTGNMTSSSLIYNSTNKVFPSWTTNETTFRTNNDVAIGKYNASCALDVYGDISANNISVGGSFNASMTKFNLQNIRSGKKSVNTSDEASKFVVENSLVLSKTYNNVTQTYTNSKFSADGGISVKSFTNKETNSDTASYSLDISGNTFVSGMLFGVYDDNEDYEDGIPIEHINIYNIPENFNGGSNPFTATYFAYINPDKQVIINSLGYSKPYWEDQTNYTATGSVDTVFTEKVFQLPDGEKADKIYSNNRNIFVVTESKKVFAMGDNYRLLIGIGTMGNTGGSENPSQINILTQTYLVDMSNNPISQSVKKVVMGMYNTPNSGIITTDGDLYMSGATEGRAANSTSTNPGIYQKPNLVYFNGLGPARGKVKDALLVAGYEGLIVLDKDGYVWASLQYITEKLTNNYDMFRLHKVKSNLTTYLTDISAIYAAGDAYLPGSTAFALGTNGNLYVWGGNTSNTKFTGNTTSDISYATLINGFFNNEPVTNLWCGNKNNCDVFVKTSTNKVFTTGKGTISGLGITNSTTGWKQIKLFNSTTRILQKMFISNSSTDLETCFAITLDNTTMKQRLWVTGDNSQGQAGLNMTTTNITTWLEIPIFSGIVENIKTISSCCRGNIFGYNTGTTVMVLNNGTAYVCGRHLPLSNSTKRYTRFTPLHRYGNPQEPN
jgi:alpha-tubulin suppressor-like RCC1 family protein